MNSCPICLEPAIDDAGLARLRSTCNHVFCRSCLVGWLEMCESKSCLHPNCPKCRQAINGWDIVRILGRSLKDPITTTPGNQPEEPDGSVEEVDETTMGWLMEQGAQQCPGCGIWIIRSYGCDHLNCRCGQYFCFHCGKMECDETGVHQYYDGYEDPYEDPYDDPWEQECMCCGGRRFDCRCWLEEMLEEEALKWEQEEADGFSLQRIMEGAKDTHGGKKARKWKGNSRTRSVDRRIKRLKEQLRQKSKARKRPDHRAIITSG